MKDWCRAQNIKTPGFIAAEDYGPTDDTPWLQNLWQSPSQFQQVDNVGVHIYSKHRDAPYVAAMHTLAKNDHGKGLWDTELHWNDQDGDDNVGFDDMKSGMLTAFDHFDDNYRAVSWWAFQPRSRGTKSSFVMSELVSSTLGANNLATDDGDGNAVGMGKLDARAFKNGPNEVTLWVANFDKKNHKDQKTEIANQTVTGAHRGARERRARRGATQERRRFSSPARPAAIARRSRRPPRCRLALARRTSTAT